MKKYIRFSKLSFMSAIVFRFHFFFTYFSNLLYIFIIYFLWKSIYESSPDQTIQNTSFQQTFIYLSIASALHILFTSWTDFSMSEEIISGTIAVHLTKPYNFQLTRLFDSIGLLSVNLLIVTIPTFIILISMYYDVFNFGINMLFFVISIIISFLITFLIDFCVGCIAFYTESIMGFILIKESVVIFLSGAVIPLYFFPDAIRKVLNLLPFQAIYNTPLTFLFHKEVNIMRCLSAVMVQLFWLAVLFGVSRVIFNVSIKKIKVNGG